MSEGLMRVWAEVSRGTADPLPQQLAGLVRQTARDAATWSLAEDAPTQAAREFLAWRRGFVHTIPLGSVADLRVLSAWLRRAGHDVDLDRGGTRDQAAVTALWWNCSELTLTHPALRRTVDQLETVAALSRSVSANVVFRVRSRRWPTHTAE